MQPEKRDAGYLWDMLDAARSAQEFTTGATYHQYSEDKKLRLAVERAVEIIGEAATKVSKKFREDHTEIPWQMIINQRHVIVHEYGELEDELIWKVATVFTPDLIAKLEKLIPPLPPETK
jgi:uncharacterized protein with HEPN domain